MRHKSPRSHLEIFDKERCSWRCLEAWLLPCAPRPMLCTCWSSTVRSLPHFSACLGPPLSRPHKNRKAPPGAAPKRPARKAAAAAKAAITPKGQPKSFEAVFQDRLAGIEGDKSSPKPKAATPKRPRAEQDPGFAEMGIERRSKRAVVVERNVEREQEERQRAKSRKTVSTSLAGWQAADLRIWSVAG